MKTKITDILAGLALIALPSLPLLLVVALCTGCPIWDKPYGCTCSFWNGWNNDPNAGCPVHAHLTPAGSTRDHQLPY